MRTIIEVEHDQAIAPARLVELFQVAILRMGNGSRRALTDVVTSIELRAAEGQCTLESPTSEWASLFELINVDTDVDFVPFTDIDFYAQQIHNLTDEKDWPKAVRAAQRLAEYIPNK